MYIVRQTQLTGFHISPTNLQFSWMNRCYGLRLKTKQSYEVIFEQRNLKNGEYHPLPFPNDGLQWQWLLSSWILTIVPKINNHTCSFHQGEDCEEVDAPLAPHIKHKLNGPVSFDDDDCSYDTGQFLMIVIAPMTSMIVFLTIIKGTIKKL